MRPHMEALSLSSEKLEPDGVYLLENGVDAFIYIGKEAPGAVVQDLLGAPPSARQAFATAAAYRRHVPLSSDTSACVGKCTSSHLCAWPDCWSGQVPSVLIYQSVHIGRELVPSSTLCE